MRKIIVFNRGYLPGIKFGGPVTSIHNFASWLSEKCIIKIVTLDHDYKSNERYENIHEGWNQVDGNDVLYLKDDECSYEKFEQLIGQESPDLVYLSGTLTSYFGFNKHIINVCKKLQIPILLVVRGDLQQKALKVKSYKKIPVLIYLRLFDVYRGVYFQTTSEAEKNNLVKILNINPNMIYDVPNLPSHHEKTNMRRKESNNLKVVYVGRIHPIKNLLTAIHAACRATCELIFDIYGPLEDNEYWKKCCSVIDNAPKNIHIEYKGVLNAIEAQIIYENYDALIFPTTSENYGHVIVESMLCGCPVLLSKGTTPWDDMDGIAGYTYDIQDVEGFKTGLEKICGLTQEEYGQLVHNTIDYIAQKTDLHNLLNLYLKMLESCISSDLRK